MPIADPNNCWPFIIQKFSDALINSAAFQALVNESTANAASQHVFGERLRIARDGRAWTVDELAQFGSYGQVYSAADNPFGYHQTASRTHRPHANIVAILSRFVPESDLVDPGSDSTGLTEIHDRDWQNIVGTIINEMKTWLLQNGSLADWLTVEVAYYGADTTPETFPTQGCWQGCELNFNYSEV